MSIDYSEFNKRRPEKEKVIDKDVTEGIVKENIYGNWSDVDKGIFIDGNNVNNFFDKYLNKNIRVTVEVIEKEEEEE